MSNIIEYRMRPNGLGIIVIELSVLLATNKQIHAFVPDQQHMLYEFKRIFNIGDDRLIINHEDNSINDPASDDLMKSFVPYFTADTVRLFGKEYSVGVRNKPCIGLAMHHAGGAINGDNTDPLGEQKKLKEFPFNKFATYETYSKIIKLITDAGYDVITFNSPKITVEYKSFLLNNLCDCIIGYEGGAAQLAHTLQVPSIILPWNYWFDGRFFWKDGSPWDPQRIEAHKYHIDRRTYFLKTQEEILSWDREQLKSVINNLHNNQGNNFLFDDSIVLDKETLIVDFKYARNVFGTLPEPTKQFILKHISNPQIF
jgi:hypothetical protein